jgi:CheY-like chemotaxis protein
VKLLLVDDDPDIRLVARMALKRAGFTVSEATNGIEALAALHIDRPDVILLDWMMPAMDGPEVCRLITADPAASGIPVIFMTARSSSRKSRRDWPWVPPATSSSPSTR